MARHHRPLVSAALTLLITCGLLAAPPDTPAYADSPPVITTGSYVYGTVLNPESGIREFAIRNSTTWDTVAPNTVFHLSNSHQSLIPETDDTAFLGEVGSSSWVTSDNPDLADSLNLTFSPGFASRALEGGSSASFTWKLDSVQGPGDYLVYTPASAPNSVSPHDAARPFLGTGIDRSGTPRPASTDHPRNHFPTTRTHRFNAPGMYCITYSLTYLPAGETSEQTTTGTINVAVGDSTPTTAPCGYLGSEPPVSPPPADGDDNSGETDPTPDPDPQPTDPSDPEPPGDSAPDDGEPGDSENPAEPDPGEEPVSPDEPIDPSDPRPTDTVVMRSGHADVLYPVITTEQGRETLALRSHIGLGSTFAGNNPTLPADVEHSDLIITHTDAVAQTLPSTYTDNNDYSFLAPAGSRVWTSPITQNLSEPWIGLSTESSSLSSLARRAAVNFRVDAVTGIDGDAPPGDFVLWSHANNAEGVIASTRTSLPGAWSVSVGSHRHYAWTFTAPGVYCVAVTAQTRTASGAVLSDTQQLTIAVGDDAAEEAVLIEPCGRVVDDPQVPTPTPRPGGTTPVTITSGFMDLRPTLSGNTLDASLRLHDHRGASAGVEYDIDDVIVHRTVGVHTPYIALRGNVPDRSSLLAVTTDFTGIPHTSELSEVHWSLGDVEGPGGLTVNASWNGIEELFSPDSPGAHFVGMPGSRVGQQAWEVTQPGRYCVPMTFTVPGTPQRSVTKTLTLVVDGPTDPDDWDFDAQGRIIHNGEVWRGADHGALTTPCAAQSSEPTEPTPDPGDPTEPTDPGSPTPPTDPVTPPVWKVKNGTVNKAGAIVLNDGHVDLASRVIANQLVTHVKDSATAATPRWHTMDSVVFQVLPDARTSVPASSQYRFLGPAGAPLWLLPESQQEGILWPGWSTESIAPGAMGGDMTWRLTNASGPGEFALFTSNAQQLGGVDIAMSTRDGITAKDTITVPPNTHAHGAWAFTAEGAYCLAFQRSATLTGGLRSTDSFVLAVAVGRTDVTRLDPSGCFTTVDGQPGSPDTTPIPPGSLTDSTSGNVRVLNGTAGFSPGQLLTVHIGAQHAGEWTSVWLDRSTWLGWVQVGASGALQVRLPATASAGSHTLAVKTRGGELIGWDSLAVTSANIVNPPNDGAPPAAGKPTTPKPGAVWNVPNGTKNSAGSVVLNSGHVDVASVINDGSLTTRIKDSTRGGKPALRSPRSTVLQLLPATKTTVPQLAPYGFLGKKGAPVWQVSHTQRDGVLWPGWSTEGIAASETQTGVTWALTGMEGPGDFFLYRPSPTLMGGVDVLFNTANGITSADQTTIPQLTHAHGSWAFTREGHYCLSMERVTRLASGKKSSDSFVLSVAVGTADVMQFDARDCSVAPEVAGSTVTPPASTPATGGGQASQQVSSTSPNAQCVANATVLSRGHADVATRIVGGKAKILIGDDSSGTKVYRKPSDTVIWLRPEGRTAMPAGFTSIAPAGKTVWQIPQTQNPALIWLGWNTESLTSSSAASPVTWTLNSVQGPGSVKVFLTGPFGGVQDVVFGGAGARYSVPLGVHAHGNWVFSHEGIYRLNMTQTVTLPGGGQSSGTAEIVLAVGDVDPASAVKNSSGCGVVSQASLTSKDDPELEEQAAEQAFVDAQQAAISVLPGESTLGTDAEPLTGDTQRAQLLWRILGGLLLGAGVGTGLVWWRRPELFSGLLRGGAS
ncbi:TIGR03773 family transporter-associated surface protein [Jonesia quinghaiensis]|uniref:TIGR03773 family transporter-associated surface protein n=1 Tax=Jonesia quinghaiensis TaxID=262806 RepID=UPI00048C1FED|nr:TIGR03773 family transporter-associated surface protein [Jonesia quinghaiensis]